MHSWGKQARTFCNLNAFSGNCLIFDLESIVCTSVAPSNAFPPSFDSIIYSSIFLHIEIAISLLLRSSNGPSIFCVH